MYQTSGWIRRQNRVVMQVGPEKIGTCGHCGTKVRHPSGGAIHTNPLLHELNAIPCYRLYTNNRLRIRDYFCERCYYVLIGDSEEKQQMIIAYILENQG